MPKLKCTCGDCKTCKRREYNRAYQRKNRDKLREYNREYSRKHMRDLYRSDPVTARAKQNANRERYLKGRKRWLAEQKQSPCEDCGGNFPPCSMDFHHVRGEKVLSVSSMCRRTYSLKTIEEEMAKCILICANCHRIRHAVPVDD